MLTTADVRKLRCNFVQEVAEYFRCKTYSISCCTDAAEKAFVDYKLASFTDCDIPLAEQCRLSELKVVDYYKDCENIFAGTSCSNQGTLTLSQSSFITTYTPSLANTVNGSSFAHMSLTDNSTTHVSNPALVFKVTKQDGSSFYSSNILFGDALISGSNTTLSPVSFSTSVSLALGSNSLGTYIRDVYLFRTNSNGVKEAGPIAIYIGPGSSYFSCVGCTTVNPANIYLENGASAATAITNTIRNAVLTLSGSASYIDVGTLITANKTTIFTTVKHNPSGIWYGFDPEYAAFSYSTPSIGSTADTFQANSSSTSIGKKFVVTYPCGTVTYQAPNVNSNLAATGTSFNKVVLPSPYNLTASSFFPTDQIKCKTVVLTASVTTANTPVTYNWTFNGSSVGTTATINVPAANDGTYTCVATLSTGCTLTKTIVVLPTASEEESEI